MTRIERRHYARGTYLTQESPWGWYRGGRVMCADGRVRALHRVAVTADTFFSVPAAVKVRGRTVAGYVTVECVSGSSVETDDDPAVVKFVAYSYGRNADMLPGGAWRPEEPDGSDVITRRADGIAYLTTDADTGEDTGGLYVPCSRYGRNSADCAPVAWRVAYVLARETGEEITRDALDHAMGLVVNDHDDVAYIIREYGRRQYR